MVTKRANPYKNSVQRLNEGGAVIASSNNNNFAGWTQDEINQYNSLRTPMEKQLFFFDVTNRIKGSAFGGMQTTSSTSGLSFSDALSGANAANGYQPSNIPSATTTQQQSAIDMAAKMQSNIPQYQTDGSTSSTEASTAGDVVGAMGGKGGGGQGKFAAGVGKYGAAIDAAIPVLRSFESSQSQNSAGNPYRKNEDIQNNAIMGVVGKVGGVGKVISAVDALGGAIGAPIRNKTERVDKKGNLKNKNDFIAGTTVGSLLAPHRAGLNAVNDPDASTGEKILSWTGLGGVFMGKKKANRFEKRTKDAMKKEWEDASLGYAAQKANWDAAYAEGGVIKKGNPYAKGGEVVGKGTSKSDSIKAKVKEESFVVPAENAPLAEMLRYKHLRNKGGDASLQQKGGENVRLSNGEHLFTPEEVLALRKKGIDLSKLAPNATQDVSEGAYLADGSKDRITALFDKVKEDSIAELKKMYPNSKVDVVYKGEKRSLQDAAKNKKAGIGAAASVHSIGGARDYNIIIDGKLINDYNVYKKSVWKAAKDNGLFHLNENGEGAITGKTDPYHIGLAQETGDGTAFGRVLDSYPELLEKDSVKEYIKEVRDYKSSNPKDTTYDNVLAAYDNGVKKAQDKNSKQPDVAQEGKSTIFPEADGSFFTRHSDNSGSADDASMAKVKDASDKRIMAAQKIYDAVVTKYKAQGVDPESAMFKTQHALNRANPFSYPDVANDEYYNAKKQLDEAHKFDEELRSRSNYSKAQLKEKADYMKDNKLNMFSLNGNNFTPTPTAPPTTTDTPTTHTDTPATTTDTPATTTDTPPAATTPDDGRVAVIEPMQPKGYNPYTGKMNPIPNNVSDQELIKKDPYFRTKKDPPKDFSIADALAYSQAGMGMAASFEKSPDYKIPPELLERYHQAKVDEERAAIMSRQGFSGIEKDSLMNNLALARRTDWANIDAQSSSDTGASLAMKRQASANNARNLIDVAAKDAALRQAKEAQLQNTYRRTDELAGLLASSRQTKDKLKYQEWLLRQQAAADLLDAGISNVVGRKVYDEEKSMLKK